MSRPSPRVPLTPKEGWLSDGRQVLRFSPTRWERTYQRLEITTGELLPDQSMIPAVLEEPSAARWKRKQPRGGHQNLGGNVLSEWCRQRPSQSVTFAEAFLNIHV